MNIHYSTTTGDILAFDTAEDIDGTDSYWGDGAKVVSVPLQDIDPRRQRVDPVTRAIVAKPPDPEPDPVLDVMRAVRFELDNTDKLMLPDYPLTEAERATWRDYRKALRDASKGNATAAAMLAAIPTRPDGSDGFERFRKSARR